MNKLEQAARQALGALVRAEAMYGQPNADIQTALREALTEQAHDLYTNDDKDRPAVICDRNGEVVLSLCKRCGRGESELSEPCIAKQAEQEPLMDYERINALREGEQNGAEDAYFFVRPENDTPTLRKMFCQGFERGFHKGLKYAAPIRVQDLTDDEIQKIWEETRSYYMFARAVIAKYREKNK